MLKITFEQSKEVDKLIRRLCCNYDEGNCLPLDDGETCRCVQENSCYKIFCNYFLKAVLPSDPKLYAEILQQDKN